MATPFLTQALSSMEIPPAIRQTALQASANALNNVKSSLQSKPIARSNKRFQDLIIETPQQTSKGVQQNIQQAKLKEAQRLKQELEAKLNQIQSNIETLQTTSTKTNNRPNLQNQQQREQYMKEQQARQEEINEKLRRLKDEQLERKRKKREERQKLKEKLEEESRLQQEEEKEKQAKLEKERLERVQRLKEEKERRQLEMRQRKEIADKEWQEVANRKPLFSQKEEAFYQQQKEEEAKRLEALAQRKVASQLDHHEIRKHARQFDELQRREKEKVDSMLASSRAKTLPASQAVLKDRKAQMEKERVAKERLKLIEKRAHYANLVKDMFAPSIDREKQKELELRKQTLKNPMRKYKSSNIKIFRDEDLLVSDSPKQSWKPKKFKENPLVPKPQPKPEFKKIDYLSELRSQKKIHSAHSSEFEDIDLQQLTPNQRVAKLKAQAYRIEQRAKQKEARITGIDPTSLTAIQQQDQVQDMYLKSVKAKMALLESNTSVL